jgi:hypothetical protein
MMAFAIGLILGLLAGAYGAFMLYRGIGLLASMRKRDGILLTLVGLGLKFPIIGILGYVSFRQGPSGLAGFVASFVVVYFALVWRAMRSDLYSR